MDAGLQEHTLLIVEECCDAPDPLTYLQCDADDDVTSMTLNQNSISVCHTILILLRCVYTFPEYSAVGYVL